MRGATARYTIMPVTPVSADEALGLLAEAARRITGLDPADPVSAVLLARVSQQLAEATAAVEDARVQEIAVAAIYAAGQASRPPGLRLAPPLSEPAPRPRTQSPAP